MSAPTKPNSSPSIKHLSFDVFQGTCGCRRVLHVRDGRAICTFCQVAHAVRIDSWSIRVEDPAPAAEDPTISAKEGLA
jgi:hypothetical protein